MRVSRLNRSHNRSMFRQVLNWLLWVVHSHKQGVCRFCGKPVLASDNYCTYCGRRLHDKPLMKLMFRTDSRHTVHPQGLK